MAETADWTLVEGEIVKWLPTIAREDLEFRNSRQAIVGFPSNSFCSDGMLASDNTLLALEVEAGQKHPDTNTGKYWLLVSEFKKYQQVILIHAYTPAFDSYRWRKRLAEFYIQKMQQEIPIKYVLRDYRTWRDFYQVISDLKATILTEYEQAFLRGK